MNAKQIKQLTLQARSKLISDNEILWLTLSKFIFDEIEKSALNGHQEVLFNLRSEPFIVAVKLDINFIKSKLESSDFEVDYILERSPNGKRTMLIKW